MGNSAALATADDIVNLYRLVLRREPESEATVQNVVGLNLARLVQQCFTSAEFDTLVRHPLQDNHFIRHAVDPVDRTLVANFIRPLELGEEAERAISAAASYVEVYYQILKACVDQSLFDYDLGWLEALDGGRQILRGQVFGSDGQAVGGWLLPQPPAVGPAVVEVWADGHKLAEGLANRFDHRVEALVPHNPNAAFWIPLPQGDADRILGIELRDGATGQVFGHLHVHQARFDRGLIGQFEQKIDNLTRQLEALQADLPNLSYQAAIPIENYSDFYRRWLKEPFDAPLFTDVEALVLISTSGAEPLQVAAAADAIIEQTHHRLRLAIVSPEADQSLYRDLAHQLSVDAGMDVRLVTPDTLSSLAVPEVVVTLSGKSVAHPDLVAAAAAYLASRTGAAAVYFDEDCFDSRMNGVEPYHAAPRFKPDFDADLLLQTPYVGACIAVRGSQWGTLTSAFSVLCSEFPSQIALALDAAGQSIGHWPVVMTSWSSISAAAPDEGGWAEEVRRHLDASVPQAMVKPAVDVLGADTSGRSRILWPLAEGAKASVIIPTRDRLDLLKPCVESLLENRRHNRTEMEVIIVDHQSSDPAVLAYLATLPERGNVRVMPHEGPFNWALKNNLAAGMATGEVLVFLNNDTLVLSRSWLDELTGQALRPGVGAVGCRLVYPDQTLQHGGFVASARFDNFLGHEGLFQRGHDGGYLGRHTVVRQTTAVTGACMAVSATRFAELGGFDAVAYPVDGNDVDFCFRARKQGYRILYTPYATMYHLESKSRALGAGDREHQAYVSASRRLWKKWGRLYGDDPYYNPNFDRTMTPFTRLSSTAKRL